MLELMITKRKVIKPIVFIIINNIVVFIIGYSIGLFGTTNVETSEFGYFSMNLKCYKLIL